MPSITRATAFCNNEIAYLAWKLDVDVIPGCLGFNIVREYTDLHEERPLAAYVSFRGQSNPDWQPQNTTVWPVQKFTWRDLTLRRKRNKGELRPLNQKLRYRIRAVGRYEQGLEEVETVPEFHFEKGKGKVDHTYKGKPVRLGYLTEAAYTNEIEATAARPPFDSTFTNGILSTQFLQRVLAEDGKVENGELLRHLTKPDDWLRNYLAADTIPLIREFFAQPKGEFYAALYELEDEELLGLLSGVSDRLHLILSDAGSEEGPDDAEGKGTTIYDSRNAPARKKLRALAKKPGSSFEMHDRMFNGSGHIGHNKFVVHVDAAGKPTSVITGSTNWTWSGVAGQSNNCIRIDDADAAAAFLDTWNRLKDDKGWPVPKPLSAKAKGANQSDDLKTHNRKPVEVSLAGGAKLEMWFSPNMPGKKTPPGKDVKKPPPPPPDMERLFTLLRKARQGIFFLVFMPSRGGVNSIVSKAIELGLNDTSLEVIGAISDTQAMWGYEPSQTSAAGKKLPAWSPHTFQANGISVVRATALTDRNIMDDLGDFKLSEALTLGRAIIHDKILVIDPHLKDECVVAFGSHNLGYRASYANDENLVIVRGHQALAQAYAAHVLDVYDHYRFRAVEAEKYADAKKSKKPSAKWDGFLDPTDAWQQRVSRRLARYFTA